MRQPQWLFARDHYAVTRPTYADPMSPKETRIERERHSSCAYADVNHETFLCDRSADSRGRAAATHVLRSVFSERRLLRSRPHTVSIPCTAYSTTKRVTKLRAAGSLNGRWRSPRARSGSTWRLLCLKA